jgi:nucleoside-diphosphate-sugar epimerase
MGEEQLHVVFGTGQVGSALAAHLTGIGLAVRTVSRDRPRALADGADWRAADVTDPEAAADAAKGASVVYQCLNAPYTQWPELFPPLQRGVMAAAEQSGALLVTLENLYGYGPTGGRPMTEDLPLAATTVKGRTRAAMTAGLLAAAEAGRIRFAIGRASDFFGAGVTQGSTLGERVFGNALAGKRADFIGNPGLPHTYSYVPDIAAGLATLGTDARAAGQVWHLPGPQTVTTRVHRHRRRQQRPARPLQLAQRARRRHHRARPPPPGRALHHPGRRSPLHPQRQGTRSRSRRNHHRPGWHGPL